ncbi:MAG TPA: primosomal protein N', partial [Myxococcales bacterium]|nr:primosomal protein N' [Myxococcales bacterium]
AVLRGVTGSGKTEVYLHLIAHCLEVGKTALVLVPEIALTPQLVYRFRARFGDRVAALHSQMSQGERFDQLSRVLSKDACIVIGPRSALFAPLSNLGVIVLDECHDGSFKQQTSLRYHARDLAMVRAQAAGAICVLGSATPNCEEMALVERGRAHGLYMHHRVGDRRLPEAFTVDLRVAERLPDPFDERRLSLVSVALKDNLQGVLTRGEQAIILHNRRGFAVTVVCSSCGEAVDCPHCDISLTYHQRQRRLRCHYCDYSQDPDTSCRACGGRNFMRLGAGTERIEETLREFLPSARVERFDRDTANGQRMVETLDRFRAGEIDILVGTQMLAKGHDFPRVTLVGVLLAETGLRMPHFRASEQTFQLITQVAGRAGRGDKPGQVYVQTYAPEHPAIRFALAQDHDAFVEHEMKRRSLSAYPPFGYLALLEVRHKRLEQAMAGARVLAEHLRHFEANVLGPVQAGVSKLKGIYRVHIQLRAKERSELHGQIRWVQTHLESKLPTGSRLFIDVDPVDFA